MKDLIPWRKKTEIASKNVNDPFDMVHQEMNSLFDGFFSRGLSTGADFFDDSPIYPKVDISEDKKKLIVKAELPGLDAKDIDISLDGRRLIIKGEKKNESSSEKENYHRVEMSYGYFSREIELPAEVDPSKVDATCKKGVLKITLKKTKESTARKIKITGD